MCQSSAKVKPQKQIELTSDDIKRQRKEFKEEMLQPWREGKLSREYIKAHGTKGIKATPEEIAKAENVWTGDIGDYYGN